MGKDILINKFKLPYSSVRLDLDNLSYYSPKLWAIGKLYAIKLQQNPFLHVDGDVYIWNKFPQFIESSMLVAQNIENDFPNYKNTITHIFENTYSIPIEVTKIYNNSPNIQSINAGIIGGNDIPFLQFFSEKVIEYLEKNIHIFNNLNINNINIVFEQYFFKCLSDFYKKDITCLFENMDVNFTKVKQFNLIPFKEKYIHLVGIAKKNTLACEQVEERLKYEFPEYYDRIASYIPAKKDSDTTNINYFQRTLSILGKSIVENNPNKIKLLIKKVNNQKVRSILKNVFKLEYEIHHLLTCKSYVNDIKSMYDYLNGIGEEDILEAKFILSEFTKIVKTSYYFDNNVSNLELKELINLSKDNKLILIKKSINFNTVKEQCLNNWDLILCEFEVPTTGNEIIQTILNKYKQVNLPYNLTKIKDKVIHFISWHLVIEKNLTFAN